MKMIRATAVAAMLTLLAESPVLAGLADAVNAGADRLAVAQVDGSWGKPFAGPPVYLDVGGPIAIGLLGSYGMTGEPTHLTAATNFADLLTTQTSDWVGMHNPLALMDLYDSVGTSIYRIHAETLFAQLVTWTYRMDGLSYDTAGFIAKKQADRNAGGLTNLLAWDFAPMALASSRAGSQLQTGMFIQAIQSGIDTLDSSDPTTAPSDLLGLAGGILGLSWLGEDYDPQAGAFASAGSVGEMADILAGYQNANGSWYRHSNLAGPIAGDEDSQLIAYAMLALDAANTDGRFDDEIVSARNYLIDSQLPNGGWMASPGGLEHAQIDGEILWALTETVNVPAPATLSLLGIGASALLRKRRSQLE